MNESTSIISTIINPIIPGFFFGFFYFKDKSIKHIFTYFQENIIITYLIMLNYVTQGVTFRLNRLQNDKTLSSYNQISICQQKYADKVFFQKKLKFIMTHQK